LAKKPVGRFLIFLIAFLLSLVGQFTLQDRQNDQKFIIAGSIVSTVIS
jgi:hypothetical protein